MSYLTVVYFGTKGPLWATEKLQDKVVGGNPCGVSYTDGRGKPLAQQILAAARYQGEHVAGVAAMLAAAPT